jgi:hypothetical protein
MRATPAASKRSAEPVARAQRDSEEYFRRWEQSCGELQASGGPTCPVAKSSRRDLDADKGQPLIEDEAVVRSSDAMSFAVEFVLYT